MRREVFNKSNKKAIAPACVLFFSFAGSNNTDLNIIEHIALKPGRFFSLFKIFTINRADYKKVQQSRLKEFDWLWKVLVYGSYLDFNFLLRFKNNYKTIGNYLLEKDALVKQGIKRKDGNKKINVSELIGWDFLNIENKEIDQHFITPTHSRWEHKEVGYIYRENNTICKDIFTPPMLLIKETVNTRLESISAVSTQKLLFTDKVTSVKLRNTDKLDDYYLLSGLLNSNLFAYFILHKSSTVGIMIEQQIHDEEKFSFPFASSKELIKAVKELEKIINSLQMNVLMDENLLNRKKNKENKINGLINKLFDLSPNEIDLLKYAKDVIIPLTMRSQDYSELLQPIMIDDDVLKTYSDIFINRFSSGLSASNKKFIVEVWHTEQIIGMIFKVIPESEYTEDIVFINKQYNSDIIPFLLKVSSEKITDKLFVQKDIRGFDSDDFYIFKPNEKRLWHKTVAYLDADEFADAMLKAGRRAR